MSHNIAEFLANAGNQGYSFSSMFEVQVPVSQISGLSNNMSARTLSYFATDAVLPGLSVQTDPHRIGGYGPTEYRPYQAGFLESQITFLVDVDGDNVDLFHQWLEFITASLSGSNTNDNQYLMAYPESYQGDLSITHYKLDGSSNITYKLINAFPYNVTQMQVAWGNHDIMQFTASFYYTSWTTDRIKTTSSTTGTTGLVSGAADEIAGDVAESASTPSLITISRPPEELGFVLDALPGPVTPNPTS